jgi:hypothetical protein
MSKVLFWKRWTDPKFDLYDDKNDHYTDWLVKPCEVLQKILNIIHPKINYVKIDRWDTWNMDTTLAEIILPMLKQLQATKHGAPLVDDKDVPEYLRSHMAQPKEYEWDVDELHFKRWDWVIDELIWTFTQLHPDTEWEAQYHTGNIEFKSEPCEWDENGKPKMYEMKRGPNDTSKFDKKGYMAHSKRIDNGLKLFGKYYRGLWD